MDVLEFGQVIAGRDAEAAARRRVHVVAIHCLKSRRKTQQLGTCYAVLGVTRSHCQQTASSTEVAYHCPKCWLYYTFASETSVTQTTNHVGISLSPVVQ